MKETKFEKLNKYFNKHGAKLEKHKGKTGKVSYHLIAKKKFGHIKAGDEMCNPALTLSPFEGMMKRRFLG